jgi:hypothetical protein
MTQCGINPARDLGPRLVSLLAGFGEVALPGPEGGFWIYVAGPLAGALAVALGERAVTRYAAAVAAKREPSERALRVEPGSPEYVAAPHFRGQDLLDAADALRTLVPDPRDRDPTRLWRACVKLSKGNLKDLYHYVHQAKLDYRDVLYWAEYYGE